MARRQPILLQGAPGTPHPAGRILTARDCNLFRDLPAGAAAERFEDLFAAATPTGVTRIERIVSTGQATPPGTWLEQGWDEWVLLIAGSATLTMAGADENAGAGAAEHTLAPGDWIAIPAGTRHRVERTDPDRPTIWLAVHIGEPPR